MVELNQKGLLQASSEKGGTRSGKKVASFLGEQFLPVLQPGTRRLCFERLLSRPVSLWEGGSEAVCKEEGGKQRQEQSAFPGPGAGRESWSPVGSVPLHGERARTEGWEGRCPLQLVFWKLSLCLQSF